MNNTIQDELALAKKKMIEEVSSQGKTLAKLTRDNVAIVEAMICNDSAYIRTTDENAKPLYYMKGKHKGEKKYGGSSAYWMKRLKKVLIDGDSDKDFSYEKLIEGAVESVDRENSTHLNADGCGRQKITERIYKLDKDELIKCLRDPKYDDMKLFRVIAERTSSKQRARTNPSFASKFCHYACFYLFEGEDEQDNYSIYDGILKRVLPWYLEYYKIKIEYNLDDYRQYREAVDSVRKASGIEISRNGFDHLLWYYHKGRL